MMHVIAAKAVALREAMEPSFADYARRVIANARALATGLMERGFKLVSDGTDNHLMLVDLRNRGMTGKDAERALGEADITVMPSGRCGLKCTNHARCVTSSTGVEKNTVLGPLASGGQMMPYQGITKLLTRA